MSSPIVLIEIQSRQNSINIKCLEIIPVQNKTVSQSDQITIAIPLASASNLTMLPLLPLILEMVLFSWTPGFVFTIFVVSAGAMKSSSSERARNTVINEKDIFSVGRSIPSPLQDFMKTGNATNVAVKLQSFRTVYNDQLHELERMLPVESNSQKVSEYITDLKEFSNNLDCLIRFFKHPGHRYGLKFTEQAANRTIDFDLKWYKIRKYAYDAKDDSTVTIKASADRNRFEVERARDVFSQLVAHPWIFQSTFEEMPLDEKRAIAIVEKSFLHQQHRKLMKTRTFLSKAWPMFSDGQSRLDFRITTVAQIIDGFSTTNDQFLSEYEIYNLSTSDTRTLDFLPSYKNMNNLFKMLNYVADM